MGPISGPNQRRAWTKIRPVLGSPGLEAESCRARFIRTDSSTNSIPLVLLKLVR